MREHPTPCPPIELAAHQTASRSAGLTAALCFLLMTPGVALAQNAVTAQSIDLHTTFFNAGVTLHVTGDDNQDAAAALEVNVDNAGWVPAHRLSRVAPDRFVGSAFFLPEGTAVQVRVTLSDSDGVTGSPMEASGATRALQVPSSNGALLHVSPAGDDATGDGSAGAPYATVAHALDHAQAGDTVLLHAGSYHEEVTLPRGGTSSAPLTIAAAGDGPAVMDGADPGLKDAATWTDEGGNVWSSAVAETRYVAMNGVRLWRYESLADLQSLALGTPGGFFWTGGALYVRLPGNAAPGPGHEVQVSTLGRAFWLEGTPHVVITGLTIRCYGAEQYSEGIMVRDGSHGVWIVGNIFENVMPGIWVKNDVDDLTIMDNELSDRGLAEFPWYEVKAQGGMESGALGMDNQYDGQGIVFYRNRVHDSFDGLHICGDVATSTPNNADVMANVIFHVGDDGIEADGVCSNVRILQNRFEQALVGVSTAPSVGGPTYVIRNLMVDLQNVTPDTDWSTRAMKFNVGDSRPSGEIFAYHNTAVTYEAGQAAFAVTDDSRWAALHLRNNIWVGVDYAFTYQNSRVEPFGEDYDLLYAAGSGLVWFQGTHYDTAADYFTGEGLCEHCLAANPLFEDGLGGEYALSASSPALDVAELIPGVNDAFEGAGPDMGALERGAPLPPLPDGGLGPDARPDASPTGDGGAATTDAGAGADAGPGPGGDSGGCGCRAGGEGAGDEGAGGVGLLLLVLLALLRRRRSRPSRVAIPCRCTPAALRAARSPSFLALSVILPLALSVILAGCGDDDDDGPTPTVAPGGCGLADYEWLPRSEVGDLLDHEEDVLSPMSSEGVDALVTSFTPFFSPVPYGARVFHVRYSTQDKGRLVEATGLVGIPDPADGASESRPIVVWTHGTTGFMGKCAPSYGTSGDLLAVYLLSSLGYVVVAPDYIGLDAGADFSRPPPVRHAYLNIEQTGIGALDALRAGMALLTGPEPTAMAPDPDRVIFWGGSQGGHAALAADLLAPYYAPEFGVVATVAMVPPSDLTGLADYALSSTNPATAAVAAFLTSSHYWYEGTEPWTDLLSAQEPWEAATALPEALYAGCDAGDTLDGATAIDQVYAADLLAEAQTDGWGATSPWGCYLAENSFATTHIPRIRDTPVFMVLSAEDTLVYTPVIRADFDRLCGMGYRLTYLECAGAAHAQGAVWSLPEQMAWIDDRLAGKPLDPTDLCVQTAPVRCQGQPAE